MKRALLLTACLLAVAGTARSYKYEGTPSSPVRWPTPQATIYHDSGTISGSFVTELQQALATWSGISGSKFRFYHGGSASNAYSGNGKSEAWFDNSMGPYAYAVTYTENRVGSTITERDVAFNSNGITWKTSSSGSSSDVDFRTVAIHEYGHVLGLLHEPSNASVMNVTNWDPVIPRHYLTQDDKDGVIFLYPDDVDPGPGPGPGPGPVDAPDLEVTSVKMSPADAVPGERVTISYSMRNKGTKEAPSFRVNAYLTGKSAPTSSDLYLGYALVSQELGVGATRSGSIDATLPTTVPPGAYRVGVILDPTGSLGETDQVNNAGGEPTGFRVDRPALAVAPGTTVMGKLGPRGRDTFALDLPAGTSLKLRAKQDRGSLTMELTRAGDVAPMQVTSPRRRVREKVKLAEPGALTLQLASDWSGEANYELTIDAKKVKTAGVADVAGVTRIPFFAFRGSKVSAVVKCTGVKGAGRFAPAVSLEGDVAAVKANRAGNRVKVGPFTAAATGELTIVVDPGEETATARYSIVVKPAKAKKGLLLTR